MATYSLEIYSLNVSSGTFTRIDIIDTYQDLQFFNRINGVGGCQFKLDIFDKKASRANLKRFGNQVCIKRSGVVKFFGPITNVSSTFTNVRGKLTIDAQDFLYHLKTRYTGALTQYVNVDYYTYLNALITLVLGETNGGLGLTVVAPLSTPNTLSATTEYTNVMDEMTRVSGLVDGLDFLYSTTVNANNLVTGVNLNFYYPRTATRRTDLNPLQIGQNIQTIQFKTSDSIYNAITGLGAGSDQVITSNIEDGASEQAYTRREYILPLKQYSVPSVISLLTTAYANQKKVEQYAIDLVLYPNVLPTVDQLNLGDIIPLNIQVKNVEGFAGDYVNFQGDARLTELAVAVDSVGRETITPKLTLLN